MSDDETALMMQLFIWLYDGYAKFGGNQFTDAVIDVAIREATRQAGVRKNTKISQKALKLLGDCPNYKALEKARKNNPGKTVEEHFKPVKQFFKELKAKKAAGEQFTEKDAERWFDEAVIAIITKAEDKKLTGLGYREERPPAAYKQAEIELQDFFCRDTPKKTKSSMASSQA